MQRKAGINKKPKQAGSSPRIRKAAAGQTTLTQHFGAESEQCPICSKQFSSVAALIEHAETQHAPQQQQDRGRQEQQSEQTQWWKQPPSDPVVAHCRFSDGSPLQPVRLSALSDVAPVELVLHALPANLEGWVAGSWWFGGQQHTAPRTSATYSLLAPTAGAAQEPSADPTTAPAPPSQDLASLPQLAAPLVLQQAAELVTTAVNSRLLGSTQLRTLQQQRAALTAQLLATRPAARTTAAAFAVSGRHSVSSPAAAAQTVARPVHSSAAPSLFAADAYHNEQAAGTQQPQQTEPQQHRQQQQQPGQQQQQPEPQWQPSYVLANLYRDGQQSVGSHTDRLSSLGPLPTIASVSLGAGRVFRLHPADATVAATAAAAAAGVRSSSGGGPISSSNSNSSSSGRVVSSIDIHLPHNSLLIMWPPTQEQWKHEVPKTKTAVTSHPVSGSTRINLTFRQLQPDWAAAVPNCRCGRPSIMRCGLQAGRFVYYYACDNTKGPGCGLYQPAVALDPGSWRAVTESCWVSVDAR